MIDKSLDKEISRGYEAERLMGEPMIKEAFDIVEQDLLAAMLKSSIGDVNTHHELVLSLQILGRIRGHFKIAMETGKLATIQKESVLERAKKLVKTR